jgi:hypothetical protein
MKIASRIVLVVVSVACLSMAAIGELAAPASTPDSITSAAEIERLERERQDAFVRGDLEALDRATASDYTTINGAGKLSTKPQMMKNLRRGATKVLSVELRDMKVRLYGNTAVLTGDYRDVNVREGVQRTTHALFTRIFVKSNDQWMAVAYQQTPVIEP